MLVDNTILPSNVIDPLYQISAIAGATDQMSPSVYSLDSIISHHRPQGEQVNMVQDDLDVFPDNHADFGNSISDKDGSSPFIWYFYLGDGYTRNSSRGHWGHVHAERTGRVSQYLESNRGKFCGKCSSCGMVKYYAFSCHLLVSFKQALTCLGGKSWYCIHKNQH